MNEIKKQISASTDATAQPPADLLDVIRTLFRYKWTLMGICLAAGIGAAIIVLLLPQYYRATTTFLAVSPDQATPELIFGSTNIRPQLYGNANDIDRLMTIAESKDLVMFLVDSFDLYRHYDIDSTKARAPYSVHLAFFDLYEITKTKRDALELSIEDTDPRQAAAIATAAREKIGILAQDLIKQGQLKSIIAFEENVNTNNQKLAILNDSLVRLRTTYGIYNAISQSEALTGQLAEVENTLVNNRARLDAYRNTRGRSDSVAVLTVRIAGQEKELENVQAQLERFNQGTSLVRNYESQYQDATSTLNRDQDRLKQYQAIYESNIPTVLLVEEAAIPIVRSRPKRTLTVLAVCLVAFVLGAAGILLFETYREVNWRAIYHGR